MAETGMTKRMQTHTFFAFLKQTPLNVYIIILRRIMRIKFFDFSYFQHIHFIEIWVTGMTHYLSDSVLTLVNQFIFTSKQTFN